ncbi:hypothetical protein NDU88_002966 [Pleurodeles waltl]|uniref:Uncharacterized protein n=1 Tax=Pleurodeles waltl TaxID=8319 RepID=A0AAV7LHF5_PLEWA|nr:hypothetical protein NDU88_002966 [Pleurodeles waltl]
MFGVLQARPLTGEVCERTGLLPVRSYAGLLPGELVRRQGPAGSRLGRRRGGVFGAARLLRDCRGAGRGFSAVPSMGGEESRGRGALGSLVGPQPHREAVSPGWALLAPRGCSAVRCCLEARAAVVGPPRLGGDGGG